MEEASDSDAAQTPFTITSLQQCAANSTPAQAAVQIRQSLNKSQSLTPTKITARIEATELPPSLVELSQKQQRALKTIQFNHLREERKKKALALLASLENDDLDLE